jgi:glycosyltransferase involved in cell wall biosynthesis
MTRSRVPKPRVLVQLQPYQRISTEYSPADRWGAQVAQHDLCTALLNASVVDEVFFVAAGSAADAARQAAESVCRFGAVARFGTAHDLPALEASRALIFLEPLGSLPQALHLRSLLRLDAPAFGLLHAVPSPLGRGFYHSLQAAMTARDAIIASSRAGQSALAAIFTQVQRTSSGQTPRIVRIPLATTTGAFAAADQLDARRQWNIPEDVLVIGCVGRFSETSKADLEPLISAVRDLSARTPCHLLCAGADAEGYADRMIACARAYGIGDRLTVLRDFPYGAKPRIHACADIFASIADNVQETFGLALIEAMAAGVPVVASDWSGYRDIVAHGETGFLIETEWSEEAARAAEIDCTLARGADLAFQLARTTIVARASLLHYLSALAHDPLLRHTLGAHGRARAARLFDWDAVVPQYARLVDETLELEAVPVPAPAFTISDVFREYPSGRFPRTGTIALCPTARRHLAHLTTLEHTPPGDGARGLLERLQREGALSLASLYASDASHASIRAAAWLVKRGICTVTSAESAT